MKTLGYYNGTIDTLENIKVPMLDRGCYFGDGVYDVCFCRNYRIYALEEHVDRFLRSASLLKITPCIEREALIELLNSLVRKMDDGNLWVYFQMTRGTALRGHAFPKDTPANLWVMLKPGEIADTYKPMRCISLEDTRFLHCNIKTINLIPAVMATQDAVDAGADEAILHRGEIVTECAHSNVSILKNGTIYSHPTNNLILPGIARAHLLNTAKDLGLGVVEEPFTMQDLTEADEIIITATSALCMRVLELDGKPIGGKDSTTIKQLQDALLGDYLKKTEA